MKFIESIVAALTKYSPIAKLESLVEQSVQELEADLKAAAIAELNAIKASAADGTLDPQLAPFAALVPLLVDKILAKLG